MELWLNRGNLVQQNEWEYAVDSLRSSTKSFYRMKTQCLAAVETQLVSAVQKRIPAQKFCVFLSGGVDSSLLALLSKKLHGDFIVVTVGVKDSPDMKSSQTMADALGVEWISLELTESDCEKLAKKALSILPVTLHDPVSVGISVVVIAAVEVAWKQGVTYFIGGLGAEELFAGYKRHLDAADVHEECWNGLRNMWTKDLVRDAALGGALGITVATPFLDAELIQAAMRVPGKWKIVDGERKVILREVAEKLGVPHSLAWRKKQAAQYGSGVDKMIEKLAKRKQMTKSAYITSLAH